VSRPDAEAGPSAAGSLVSASSAASAASASSTAAAGRFKEVAGLFNSFFGSLLALALALAAEPLLPPLFGSGLAFAFATPLALAFAVDDRCF